MVNEVKATEVEEVSTGVDKSLVAAEVEVIDFDAMSAEDISLLLEKGTTDLAAAKLDWDKPDTWGTGEPVVIASDTSSEAKKAEEAVVPVPPVVEEVTVAPAVPSPAKFEGKSDLTIAASLARLADHLGVKVEFDNMTREQLVGEYTRLESVQGVPPASRAAAAVAKGFLPVEAPPPGETPAVSSAKDSAEESTIDEATLLMVPVAQAKFDELVQNGAPANSATEAQAWQEIDGELQRLRAVIEKRDERQEKLLEPLIGNQRMLAMQQDVHTVLAGDPVYGVSPDELIAYVTPRINPKTWEQACKENPAAAKQFMLAQAKDLVYQKFLGGQIAAPTARPQVPPQAGSSAIGASARSFSQPIPPAVQQIMDVMGKTSAEAREYVEWYQKREQKNA